MARLLLIVFLGLVAALMPLAGAPAMAGVGEDGCHGTIGEVSEIASSACEHEHQHTSCGMAGSCATASCTPVIASALFSSLDMPNSVGAHEMAQVMTPREHVIRPPVEPPRTVA